ncbi:GAF domain-containing sensor histidine kinase [Uliginosibacterium sp. H3]|uniref:histidine kinase n=1 Tax=Uliginosibacterium silvisoli TaxID=3114758 RepID=A0ABU6K8Y9_9RHOO|nr:GAF domain-containing sensor histidine kinase [Uliginosibacterium sp. H3]
MEHPVSIVSPLSAASVEQGRASALLCLQNAVLEAVAVGRDLSDALSLLCHGVESLAGDVMCSVLLLEDGLMHHGAAPSLPAVFVAAIDGSPIGPNAGSCGTAAFTGLPVEVHDIEHDPLWEDYKSLALPHGLLACWSSPILAHDGQILGTFALYFREVRGPDALHRDAVRIATPLAAIAIERSRMDSAEHARVAALAASNERIEQLNYTLEQRVLERTRDLSTRNEELARAFEELQRTHGQLLEARKLVSLSRLVVGVAHELNTPIGNARVMATSLLERCNAFRRLADGPLRRSEMMSFTDDLSEGCRILADSLEMAADRVGRFKSVAVDHSSSLRRSFVLRELVEDIAALFEPAMGRYGCVLRLEVPSDILLDSYPEPLGQVLSNVFDNAVEHGLPTRQQGGEPSCVLVSVTRPTEAHVQLSISDNGGGIAEDVADRIFEPFFTTRLSEGCSGLGLYVARKVVNELLGGTIALDRRASAGTTLLLRIPLVAPRDA